MTSHPITPLQPKPPAHEHDLPQRITIPSVLSTQSPRHHHLLSFQHITKASIPNSSPCSQPPSHHYGLSPQLIIMASLPSTSPCSQTPSHHHGLSPQHITMFPVPSTSLWPQSPCRTSPRPQSLIHQQGLSTNIRPQPSSQNITRPSVPSTSDEWGWVHQIISPGPAYPWIWTAHHPM